MNKYEELEIKKEKHCFMSGSGVCSFTEKTIVSSLYHLGRKARI